MTNLYVCELKAGGKPSTWFPPGGLVEQDISTLTKIHISNKLQQENSFAWLSKDGMHKHFSQSAIPQWPWCVANPEYNANDPDYSLAYSLCFATSQHAHNQHLQTSAMHTQNRIHKNKNVKHKYYFQSCFTIEPGKIIQAKSNITNIL